MPLPPTCSVHVLGCSSLGDKRCRLSAADMAYQNVHWPLEAPQKYLDMFKDVPDDARQHVCAMAKIMDDGIGNITRSATIRQRGKVAASCHDQRSPLHRQR